MQNWGENAPVSAFLHSSQSIFAFFTKHFCILHKAFLLAKTSSLEDCKHGIREAQTWHLRIVNMAFTMRNHGIYES